MQPIVSSASPNGIDPTLLGMDADRISLHINVVSHNGTVIPDRPHMLPAVSVDTTNEMANSPPMSIHLSDTNVRLTTPPNAGSAGNAQATNVRVNTPPHIGTRSRNVQGANDRPTTPPNIATSAARTAKDIPNKTPTKRPAKRPQVNLSPAVHQTRAQKMKKKVTDDDRAALEAQNMVQSGSRRRVKPTRRH